MQIGSICGMMGLGQDKKSDDQVSLLDVSIRRLPVYLWIVLGVVIVGVVLSIVGTVRQGKGWCLESLMYFLGAMAEYLNGPVSATILACGVIEGFIVGLTKILLRQTKQHALEEGIQQGIAMERERLRRAGVEVHVDSGQQTGRVADRAHPQREKAEKRDER